MAPELAYFLKINIAIVLFYAFYRLFFYKDTFFQWRRIALLGFFIVSLLYPLLNFQDWIKTNEPMAAVAGLYATVILPQSQYPLGTVASEAVAPVNWAQIVLSYVSIIYLTGAVLLGIRFFIQLGNIIHLYFHCKKKTISGSTVHLLDESTGPFSFFGWIFIHLPSHSPTELEEILIHENAHARQYHSIDVIFGELMCITCWFNPFVWLLKREIRNNLEYMADHKVLETGHDSKAYQYHLLGLAHHKAAANLSNSFNVLPLKKRIKMMNKKRTKGIGRAKYILFLPMAALLMMISNIEAVARTTKELTKDVIQETTEQVIVAPEMIAVANTVSATTVVPQQNKKKPQKKDTTTQTNNEEDKIYDEVEVMPQFPGSEGNDGLMRYIMTNTNYPPQALENNVQGRVNIEFIVKKDGSVSNVKVVAGNTKDPFLQKEAVRVIKNLPKFTPGLEKGKPVNVRFIVPLIFKLPNSKPAKKDASKNVSVSYKTKIL